MPLTYGEGCPVFGEVPKDSAADKAGLKEGDRLFEMDGTEISDRRSVLRVLRDFRSGETINVIVERNGQGIELLLQATMGESR